MDATRTIIRRMLTEARSLPPTPTVKYWVNLETGKLREIAGHHLSSVAEDPSSYGISEEEFLDRWGDGRHDWDPEAFSWMADHGWVRVVGYNQEFNVTSRTKEQAMRALRAVLNNEGIDSIVAEWDGGKIWSSDDTEIWKFITRGVKPRSMGGNLPEADGDQKVLVVVHPGSLGGSASMILGKDFAADARQRIAAEAIHHDGPVFVVLGELADEIERYSELRSILDNADKTFKYGPWQDELSEAAARIYEAAQPITSFILSGAWDESDGTGCINCVAEALSKLGADVEVSEHAVSEM